MDRVEEVIERLDLVAVWRTVIMCCMVGGLAVAASFCGGCGGPAQQHRDLNALTAVADPTYALAVETCDAARDAIVDRVGSTYAEDRAAMDEIHRVCDGIVAGFETLRGSQLTARAAIDAGAEGAIREAILAALALWADLQALIPQLDELGIGGQ